MSEERKDHDGESTEDLHPELGDVTEPDSSVGPKSQPWASEGLPERVGPYKILDILGMGGMGVVYLAEQTEPIRRRVALKLVKLGMDTQQVIARFESERQALALMNHPNVAKVLDAGATEQGRPYFVMEHVAGVPVTEYCDHHRLDTTERLQLFTQVCEAVQHAHQKGIIHRDIKPSNVLVTVRDGQPVPKVIDFGVAKATEHRLTEKTIFTEQGQLIGTPEYMSPEQAEMTGLDIDTRTDIYSLGVLLYEMLVGALPFEPKSLRQAGLAEIQRIIREQEPSKPSTRLSSLGDESGAVANKRRVDIASLARQLRGDLDWITMKALDKDRTRRYASASELAEDINRHVRYEPVKASPPGAGYRLRKFVKRNSGSVIATTIVAVVLVLGVIGTTWGMLLALDEKTRANSISAFLQSMLSTANPYESGDRNLTVVEMLDQASVRATNQLSSEPEVEATVRRTIGTTYHDLGLSGRGEHELRRAIELGSHHYGEDHAFVADTLHTLFWLLEKDGRYDEAKEVCLRSLSIRRRLYGDDHPAVGGSLDALGDLYRYMGDLKAAERLLRQAQALYQKLSIEPPAIHMNDLALVLRDKGQFAESASLFRMAIEKDQRELGVDHPQPYRYAANLGLVLLYSSNFTEAEQILKQTCEVWTAALGPSHPFTLEARHHYAEACARLGRMGDAERAAIEAVKGYRESTAGATSEFAHALTIFGMVQIANDKLVAAELVLREALDLRNKVAPDSWRVGETKSFLGAALAGQGEFMESEALLLEAYQIISRHTIVPYAEHEAMERIQRMYAAWHSAEPGKGYAEKAAEWRAKLEESEEAETP